MSKIRRAMPTMQPGEAREEQPVPGASGASAPSGAPGRALNDARSRRDLIRAGLAGAAGLALGTMGAPAATDAAAGGSMLLGRANSAGTSGTSLTTKSTAAALTVAQTGTGPGVRASSTTGQAGAFSSSKGHGITATSAALDRQGLRVTNTAALPGVAVRALAGGTVDAAVTSLGLMAAAGEFASSAVGLVGTGGDKGVAGVSTSGTGVYAYSPSGTALYAESNTSTGVFAYTNSGDGVFGYSTSGRGGIFGSNSGTALQVDSNAKLDAGLAPVPAMLVTNAGDMGGGDSGVGIRVLAGGKKASDLDALAMWPAAGQFASGGNGVVAIGYNAVYGVTDFGTGVTGQGNGASSGVIGFSDSGIGVRATSTSGTAVDAYTGNASAIAATIHNDGGGTGLAGGRALRAMSGVTFSDDIESHYGFLVSHGAGEFAGPSGLIGIGKNSAGVYGASPTGDGVVGLSTNGFSAGVLGYNGVGGYGVYSQGPAYVSSSLSVVGTLSKGGGSFKIDHPLDPANKFLYHSFVESPDMKNVYDGVVELDARGEAVVTLPDWFEALNRDVRYQLTGIGRPMPDLHVADEVSAGSFTIGGGAAGRKVSWQVTGIRRDAWAEENRIPVEVAKTGDEAGRYLHPSAHGKPETAGIGHVFQARREQRAAASSKG